MGHKLGCKIKQADIDEVELVTVTVKHIIESRENQRVTNTSNMTTPFYYTLLLPSSTGTYTIHKR